jgi:hypothetical protein
MLVSSKHRATERQWVAFQATEQERSGRKLTHRVGTEDDAREIPDCIGHARFEREDRSISGPAGLPPAQVPKDSDHRDSVIDGGADPAIDLS